MLLASLRSRSTASSSRNVSRRALSLNGIDDSLEVAKLRAGLRRCSHQNSLTTSPALAAATLGGEAAQGEAAADVGGGGGAGGYESPVDEASEGLGTPPAPMVHPSGTLGVSVGGSTGGEVEAAAAAGESEEELVGVEKEEEEQQQQHSSSSSNSRTSTWRRGASRCGERRWTTTMRRARRC